MTTAEGYVPMPDGVRLFFQKIGSGPEVVIPNGPCLIDDLSCLADEFTLICYDLRNRGRSDQSLDDGKPRGDIHSDADDLDVVRRYFGLGRMNLIGHSYIGLLVALYAMKFPDNADRIIQIGPMQPESGKQYPPHLTCTDGVMQEVFAQIGPLYVNAASNDPVELCRKAWAILARLYVIDPADAPRVTSWGRCELPNERTFLQYFQRNVLPSIDKLKLVDDARKVKAKVLTIHGRGDRNAPYGGGRDWAMMLPEARLITVADAAHAPWIEAPEVVFGAIRTFLQGRAWPEGAEIVSELERT